MPIRIRSPKREKTCFMTLSPFIKSDYQRQIKEKLFALAVRYPVEMPILVRIAIVPLKPLAVFEYQGHRKCILS